MYVAVKNSKKGAACRTGMEQERRYEFFVVLFCYYGWLVDTNLGRLVVPVAVVDLTGVNSVKQVSIMSAHWSTDKELSPR